MVDKLCARYYTDGLTAPPHPPIPLLHSTIERSGLLDSYCKFRTSLCYIFSLSGYMVGVFFCTASLHILRVHSSLCPNKSPLLLRGVATTSTVPASLMMGDQPLPSYCKNAHNLTTHKGMLLLCVGLKHGRACRPQKYHADLGTCASLTMDTYTIIDKHTRHDITSYVNYYDAVTGPRFLLLKGYQSNRSDNYHTLLLDHLPNCHGCYMPKG